MEIFLEGEDAGLEAFLNNLSAQAPLAANVTSVRAQPALPAGLYNFTILGSRQSQRTTACISPDLPVCDECLEELFEPTGRRYGYPYINCTNCGPRYSIILGLPYDRPNTTMKRWKLDAACALEYSDVEDRRFHAQPVACPSCGPEYFLRIDENIVARSDTCLRKVAELLRCGKIIAIKGIGGYHLSCDAYNQATVDALRRRKYRKEKPFALMAQDLLTARGLVELAADGEALLASVARPIVLAPARKQLPGIAPENTELGVMLPYTPLHHLLFAAGAPPVLVMTSANRSNQPIAYEEEEALEKLSGVADAFLVGERPIARRVDDSVARAGAFGPAILRRSRGYAPNVVARLPVERSVLALGADLKNSITLVVGGQAFVSQHIGDLEHYECLTAFRQTVRDLLSMYGVCKDDLIVVHDAHPHYVSTLEAAHFGSETRAIQHHRAHLASVLAESGEFHREVLGVILDGTGFGDDGTVWGGEFFVGSLSAGFNRIAHLRQASLPGGDAAAQFPVQAAAGLLSQIEGLPDFTTAPFYFPPRFTRSLELVSKSLRMFPSTSFGRLFDTAAALLGYTRENTFEGQAATWLEHSARSARVPEAYPFPFTKGELDFRPLLEAIIADRVRGRLLQDIARAFQLGVAQGLWNAIRTLCQLRGLDTVALSGGVFQNELLLEDIKTLSAGEPIRMWTNHAVPPNDGGISLGQAALAAFG